MDSPPYLMDQFAKSRGVSKAGAKRALMMQGYASDGRTLKDAMAGLGIAKSTAQMLCRRFMIDFPDYRPYAARERKGEARPKPYHREDLPVDGLALFSGTVPA